MVKAIRTISITGASGFIGVELIREFLKLDDVRIKILSRKSQNNSNLNEFGSKIEVYIGDLSVPESLNNFLEPNCTVVNLAYIKDANEKINLEAIVNLLSACKKAEIKRFVHISTAAVSGRTSLNLIDELTPCKPVTDYGITKFKIEKTVRAFAGASIEVVVLRPTSVFGNGGRSLLKLIDDIRSERIIKNHLKACVFHGRRMNLVSVKNVTAAINFICTQSHPFKGEVFIISDDDCLNNNYKYIETMARNLIGLTAHNLPVVPVPLFLLSLILKFLRRNNINPNSNYSPNRLLNLGFKRPFKFEDSLNEFLKEKLIRTYD